MHIILNKEEGCLVNLKNGNILTPDCMVDLISYHTYLIDSKKEKEASKLLNDVWNGEKVISNMILRVSELGLK